MPTEVELRFNILTEARSILFRHWEERVHAEKATALFENRPPKVVNPPSIRKIMKVAEELYGFVTRTTPAPAPDAGETGVE
jgi:hypothetical protein